MKIKYTFIKAFDQVLSFLNFLGFFLLNKLFQFLDPDGHFIPFYDSLLLCFLCGYYSVLQLYSKRDWYYYNIFTSYGRYLNFLKINETYVPCNFFYGSCKLSYYVIFKLGIPNEILWFTFQNKIIYHYNYLTF